MRSCSRDQGRVEYGYEVYSRRLHDKTCQEREALYNRGIVRENIVG